MVLTSKARMRVRGVVALLGATVVVAGCGSSGSSSSSAAGNPGPSSSGVAIKTAKGPDGTYLIGPSGRALYLWVADKGGTSVCSGACATIWPPLTTKVAPTASGGVKAADLGTITRSDGTKQVTYKDHPLYYYVTDSTPGQLTGQGSNSFGAKWWLVAPSGAAITGP
jgi:predicted lipoprotein with Yx(FWY)xxD motif